MEYTKKLNYVFDTCEINIQVSLKDRINKFTNPSDRAIRFEVENISILISFKLTLAQINKYKYNKYSIKCYFTCMLV